MAYIWNALGLENPRVLIDIGAGTGLFSIAFAAYVPEGKVYACDISDAVYMINVHHELDTPEEMLKEAFRLLKERGKL